ncbi:MAG: hypothetical protein JNM07_08235 [Phycisphaerae bacterium]|nr:hypothetical protein [Phycisphaerae bacterium]
MPLPQFESDLEADRKAYGALKPPKSIVVRFGSMRMVGEFPYDGDAKPGCGSKLVVRTHRGTELGEMLTSTCPNAGCSKSVSRKEMLEYIENSGGRDYPFFTDGRVLRVATAEDVSHQTKLTEQAGAMLKEARRIATAVWSGVAGGVPMRLVDAEPILGEERLTFYFTSEERVDFRNLVGELAATFRTRIEMRQVGARDEARLIADYERCGQHCCCKQFLKVLKPVSMRSAKTQKATLDPLKISGRCGRLMCCLRYEDQTYEELKKRLPHRKQRVRTPDGWGMVLDSQILTQLVLVQLEGVEGDGSVKAYPVEDLGDVARGKSPRPAGGAEEGDLDTDDSAPAGNEQGEGPAGGQTRTQVHPDIRRSGGMGPRSGGDRGGFGGRDRGGPRGGKGRGGPGEGGGGPVGRGSGDGGRSGGPGQADDRGSSGTNPGTSPGDSNRGNPRT